MRQTLLRLKTLKYDTKASLCGYGSSSLSARGLIA